MATPSIKKYFKNPRFNYTEAPRTLSVKEQNQIIAARNTAAKKIKTNAKVKAGQDKANKAFPICRLCHFSWSGKTVRDFI